MQKVLKIILNTLFTCSLWKNDRRRRRRKFWVLKIPKSRSPVGRAPVLWVPRGRRASPVGARPVGAPKAEDTMYSSTRTPIHHFGD